MPAGVRRCLVVGGGIAGMAASLELRRLGVAVDLIDLDPEWRVYGAGITLTSPTLRAFGRLGILNEVLEQGFSGNGIRICAIDGSPVSEVPDPPGLPGSGGIMRPALHQILSRRTIASGVCVRLGLTVDALSSDEDGVDVVLSDGTRPRYDLVIGADGLSSRIRRLIRPDAPEPAYVGQMVWRLFADRPKSIDRRHFFLGGTVKVGVAPVSQDSLYMFLLETHARREPMDPDRLWRTLGSLLSGYGGVIGDLRDALSSASAIVLRPLEAFLLPPSWHVGRTLLIGDAAHPTTPQLASGAGMAVEDAIVLGEELARATSVEDAFDGFMRRRLDRCQLVVANSLEIGRLEQTGAPPQQQTQVVSDTLRVLAQAI